MSDLVFPCAVQTANLASEEVFEAFEALCMATRNDADPVVAARIDFAMQAGCSETLHPHAHTAVFSPDTPWAPEAGLDTVSGLKWRNNKTIPQGPQRAALGELLIAISDDSMMGSVLPGLDMPWGTSAFTRSMETKYLSIWLLGGGVNVVCQEYLATYLEEDEFAEHCSPDMPATARNALFSVVLSRAASNHDALQIRQALMERQGLIQGIFDTTADGEHDARVALQL